jgi:hypothetical protein
MHPRTAAGMAAYLLLAVSACTSEAFKSSAYEALHQKGCIDRTASPYCDPQHKRYDEYQKERDAVLNKPQS